MSTKEIYKFVGVLQDDGSVEFEDDEQIVPGVLLYIRLWTQEELDECKQRANERLSGLNVE